MRFGERGGSHQENGFGGGGGTAQKIKEKRGGVERNSEIKRWKNMLFWRVGPSQQTLFEGRYVTKTGKLGGHTICK